MDIEAMRMFLRLSETLHFGKTSKEFYLSPSAFSRAIQRIEDDVGQPLLIRDKRNVLLTHAGESFRDQCYRTVLDWDSFLENTQRTTARLEGEISLFCTLTICNRILPFILNRFRIIHPGIQLRLVVGNPYESLSKVEDELVDVCVCVLPEAMPDTIVAKVITKTALMFIGPTLPCLVSEKVNRKEPDWGTIPFILPQPGLIRSYVEQWFATKAIQPPIYSENTGNEEIPALVSLGCGIGFVPKIILEDNPLVSRIQTLSFTPTFPDLRIGICVRKSQFETPIIQALWKTILGDN